MWHCGGIGYAIVSIYYLCVGISSGYFFTKKSPKCTRKNENVHLPSKILYRSDVEVESKYYFY